MNLAENIKTIREENNFKQIEVATHIGVDKSAYSKIEKGLRALTVDELQKMSQLFNLTTDQIINYDGKIPTEVIIEDKTAVEQIRLIQLAHHQFDTFCFLDCPSVFQSDVCASAITPCRVVTHTYIIISLNKYKNRRD